MGGDDPPGLASLDPMLSPMLWTSIATGKRADQHGILGFVEPDPGGGGLRPVSSTSRRTKALWNMLHQRGMRSGVVGWFASQLNRRNRRVDHGPHVVPKNCTSCGWKGRVSKLHRTCPMCNEPTQ